MEFNFSTEEIFEMLMIYAVPVLYALVTFVVGIVVINKFVATAKKMMLKRDVDTSLQPFISSLISIGLKLILIITTIGMVGVETTSFVAIFGAVSLAIGMALSGTLQNFAGGVMILIFKPFKVGDYINAQGFSGIVKEIQIFNTILNTVDNKYIIIPNGGLSNGSMTNFSAETTRRVDWTVGIAYGDDIDKTKKVINYLIAQDSRILLDPEPFVAVSELADSSVNFTVRAWVKSEDYWDVFFAMNENIYKTFAKEGLNIPFPQMDVHVKNS